MPRRPPPPRCRMAGRRRPEGRYQQPDARLDPRQRAGADGGRRQDHGHHRADPGQGHPELGDLQRRQEHHGGLQAAGRLGGAEPRQRSAGAAEPDPGRIRGDGTVLIVNRNGILFGGGSRWTRATRRGRGEDQRWPVHRQRPVWRQRDADLHRRAGRGAGGAGEPDHHARAGCRDHRRRLCAAAGQDGAQRGRDHGAEGTGLLAAGDSFVIRKGVGTEGNTASTTRGNEVAPLFAADSGAGAVGNSGLIPAREGTSRWPDATCASRAWPSPPPRSTRAAPSTC